MKTIKASRSLDHLSEINMIGPAVIFSRTAPACRRAFWLVLTSAALGIAIFQIFKVVSDYVELPVATNIVMRRKAVLPFPTVTVCDELPKGKRFAQSLGYDFTPSQAGSDLSKCYLAHGQLSAECDAKFTPQVLSLKMFNRSQVAALINHQGNHMTVNCKFRSTDCKGVIPVRPVHTYDLMGCQEFNTPDEDGKTVATGESRSQGLTLYMVDNPDDTVGSRNTLGGGYQVIVSNGGTIRWASRHGMKMTKGSETYIRLTKEEINLQPLKTGCSDSQAIAPYSECVAASLEKETAILCNYTNIQHPDFNVKNYACRMLAMNELMSQANNSYKNCPVPCHSTKYIAAITSSTIPPENILFMNLSLDKGQTLTSLSVFFDTTAYSEVRQVFTATIWSVLADIGGALGLFLGATLLTIIQVIEVFAGRCFLSDNESSRRSSRAPRNIVPVT